MASIKQGDKSLQQYHYAVNFALNAIISKISRTYAEEAEQRSLVIESQKKAIRTFIVGMKNRTMRHILYGQQPKTLSEAYSIAQTVYYDNEYLQLEQCPAPQKTQPRNQQQNKMPYTNFEKPQNQWTQQKHYNNAEPQKQWRHKNNDNVEPMEVDVSNRTKQTNWRQPEQQNYGQKRENNSFRHQHMQPQKIQRINQLTDEVQPIPDDLISNASNVSNGSTHTNNSGAFLDE